MLTSPVSKIFVLLAVLAAAFATISFVNRAPSNAELSWPARPVTIPLQGGNHLSDYFQRHLDQIMQAAPAGIPVTGAEDLSDFYQRFKAMKSAGTAADSSDYFMRHSALTIRNTEVDNSDYMVRHPELSIVDAAADTSDYFLRH